METIADTPLAQERMIEMIRFIDHSTIVRRVHPTIREMLDVCGMPENATSQIRRYLDKLVTGGYVEEIQIGRRFDYRVTKKGALVAGIHYRVLVEMDGELYEKYKDSATLRRKDTRRLIDDALRTYHPNITRRSPYGDE